MNLQQLRYVRTAIQHNLNLTEVANRLCTSQSGVSRQIKELQAELKVDIFVRRGKRLTGLTKAGELAPHLDAAVLSGAKRRPAFDRAAPLLTFTDRADLQGARVEA